MGGATIPTSLALRFVAFLTIVGRRATDLDLLTTGSQHNPGARLKI
jgi:hypothetical protein